MKKIVSIIIFCFLWSLSPAQTQSGYVEIKGKVTEKGKALPATVVDVFDGGQKIKSATTESSGKFVMTLNFDKTYLLVFSKQGFVTKRVSFDTHVNEKQYVWPYPFTMELFKMVEGLNVSALEEPVTKISYNDEEGDFDFDLAYTNKMKAKILQIQTQIKDLEKGSYEKIIADADAKFRAKEYHEAVELYEKAIDIDPYTDYPDAQIMECERRLANAGSEKNAYDKAIASADASFAKKQYEAAKKDYQKALSFVADAAHPKNRLAEIETLLANLGETEKMQKFNEIIKQADALFVSNDLQNSKIGYQKALEIIPAHDHPTSRLAEIEARLANSEKDKATQQAYLDKIAEADRLFDKREFQISRNAYEAALAIKPNEAYPQKRLKEIADKMSSIESDNLYAEKIKKADELLAGKKMLEAKAVYVEASQVKSAETYPKERIKFIDSELAKLAQSEQLETEYNKYLKDADNQLLAKEYASAKSNYTKALELKPKELYPQTKINEINSLLAQLQSKAQQEESYKALITKADGLLASKKYTEAKSTYNEALSIKKEEAYPKNKISEIDALLAEMSNQAEKDKAYLAKISEADKAFEKANWLVAKQTYTEASQIKSNEKYPKDQIALIDSKLETQASQEAKNAQYLALIKSANQKFESKDWSSAKNDYQSASTLKADETYPKARIAEIDKLLAQAAEQKSKDEAYQAAIKSADGLFASKDLNAARTKYIEASNIKNTESYPKTKIAEIDQMLAQMADSKAKKEMYDKHIAAADKAYASKLYSEAKQSYQSASSTMPAETYPKTQLAAIAKIEQELEAANALQKDYDKKIAEADSKWSKKDLAGAKVLYLAASEVKPQESYPKTQVAEIDKLLAQLAADKSKNDQYNALIGTADGQLSSKQYAEAKATYQSALAIKSNEAYPKEKIAEIDQVLKLMADQNAQEKQYNDAIQKADAALVAKDYNLAKTNYQSALTIKPKESYPKTKISEIEKLIADQAKQNEQNLAYQNAMDKANSQMSAKDYSNARLSYEAASKIKPTEQMPKDKIKEIEAILAQLLADKTKNENIEKDYLLKIQEGDRLLAKREFQIARNAYQSASDLKPNEAYPKTKISEIDGVLQNMAKDANYAAKLKEGSDALAAKNYSVAKTAYTAALEIKPNETFPKEKLAAIEKMLADEAAKAEKAKVTAQYVAAVEAANAKFDAKKYDESKALYQSALEIDSKAQYPKDRIILIDKLLAEQASKASQLANEELKKKDYADLIKKADDAFNKQDYTLARSTYVSALKLIPQQTHPTARIAEIDKLTTKKEEDIPAEINFASESDKKQFVSEMAKKYGEGVHVENYESKSGKKVKRVIVVKSGLADEYREVKQPWGDVYYFKNGKSVSRTIFFEETK